MVTIEQFMSEMLGASLIAHQLHLNTNKYSAHIALDDFYTEIQDITDSIIEQYYSKYPKINFKHDLKEYSDPIVYLNYLKDFIVNNRGIDELNDTGIQSSIDNAEELINSTLYKLKRLTESKRNLSRYLNNILRNE